MQRDKRAHSRAFLIQSIVVLLALVITACAQPAPMAPEVAPAAGSSDAPAASTGGEAATTGEAVPGGVFQRNSSADASNLNPILYDDTASGAVVSLVYPALIGVDPVTGEYTTDGSMSESWEVSEDGLTWTFTLREGITWSDGDPVDSADFKFTYDAVIHPDVASPRKYVWEQIDRIETPDPRTVVVHFKTVKCDALGDVGLGWLPSHLYDTSDFASIMTEAENEAPRVSAGPFVFQNWARDENITLLRNESYWEGAPLMDGMIIKVVPDAGARLAQLQSGEVDILEIQPNQVTAVENDPNITLYTWDDDGFDYIGLNLANPANPQPGVDENGNLIPQEPHPVLGDVRVRKAIAHALDYDAIINDIFFGYGIRQTANVIPAIDWAYNSNLAPYEYDLDRARALLDEAGWVDSDGDGVREKDGVPMNLTLLTNAGNTIREDLGAYMQDQLNSIGFNIDFQAIDFGTLLEQMDAQTYDMYIIGWVNIGSDPNDDNFWKAEFDVPGSGFNNTSFQNAEVEELLVQGYSVPGCDPAERAPIYQRIQEIIHDELPYIYIRARVGILAYRNSWQGLDPQPWSIYYNVHEWSQVSAAP
jgi:peptide/nickel transport system substrate-binding protein